MGAPRERLKVAEFCQEMRISRSTFYEWRAKGTAPRCRKLPNGELRIDRTDIERWYESLGEAA
ncbi:helix-turn-helix domain-containing protein [Saccharothrix xinjiangensis]|uniref:Helix-turn-helix transcriptional regulator n=1 Tax=Saccharothrix xinjiangensis TaxID=204798 RepID=A0ABV9XS32_9PSEU